MKYEKTENGEYKRKLVAPDALKGFLIGVVVTTTIVIVLLSIFITH